MEISGQHFSWRRGCRDAAVPDADALLTREVPPARRLLRRKPGAENRATLNSKEGVAALRPEILRAPPRRCGVRGIVSASPTRTATCASRR